MNPSEVLHNHRLKSTSCREGIVEVMLQASRALSEAEIKTILGNRHDRTTFYRSFKTLIEKEVIHQIVIDKNEVRYALNLPGIHQHEHVHFHCSSCNQVFCVEPVSEATMTLPSGFDVSETEIMLKGKCNHCKS